MWKARVLNIKPDPKPESLSPARANNTLDTPMFYFVMNISFKFLPNKGTDTTRLPARSSSAGCLIPHGFGTLKHSSLMNDNLGRGPRGVSGGERRGGFARY